ncbi:hypothetical protein [Methylobacterium aquaticum]|uniref:hypothetical protein n=1 Tax=Methylobacterium aquaticum TaxID=270351 RepID=UPI0012E104E3|nr:hypothetical protein [Methylobacterium aquaticum]
MTSTEGVGRSSTPPIGLGAAAIVRARSLAASLGGGTGPGAERQTRLTATAAAPKCPGALLASSAGRVEIGSRPATIADEQRGARASGPDWRRRDDAEGMRDLGRHPDRPGEGAVPTMPRRVADDVIVQATADPALTLAIDGAGEEAGYPARARIRSVAAETTRLRPVLLAS